MAPPSNREPGDAGAIPGELTLLARPHVSTRRNGLFAATHPYVEECFTSILGPTSVLLLRRTALLFCEREPTVVDAADLAASLGLGRGLGRNHPLGRTIERLRQFRLVAWEPGPALAVAQLLPALNRSQLARVPEWVRARHELHLEALGRGDPEPADPALRPDRQSGRTGAILGLANGTASWQHRPDRPSGHPENCNGPCCWRPGPTNLLRRRADGAVGGPQASPGGPGASWWAAGRREPGPGRSR